MNCSFIKNTEFLSEKIRERENQFESIKSLVNISLSKNTDIDTFIEKNITLNSDFFSNFKSDVLSNFLLSFKENSKNYTQDQLKNSINNKHIIRIKGELILLDGELIDNYFNKVKGSYKRITSILKDREFNKGALSLLQDIVKDQYLNPVKNSSVAVSTSINENEEELNSLENAEDSSEEEEIDNTIFYISENKSGVGLFKTLPKEYFIETYFKGNETKYSIEYSPYIKSKIKGLLFNTTKVLSINEIIDNKEDNIDIMDFKSPLITIIDSLKSINKDYNLNINEDKIKNTQKSLNQFRIEIAKSLNLKYNKEVLPLMTSNSLLENISRKQRNMYYDLVYVNNLRTTILNDVNFVTLDINDKGKIDFALNIEMKNKRVNYDNKKTSDQNTELIKGLISSTYRLVSIDTYEDREADLRLVLDEKIIEQYDKIKNKDLSLLNFVKNNLRIFYVLDENSPNISYEEYKKVAINKEYIKTDRYLDDTINYLKTDIKSGNVANSLFLTMYNPESSVRYINPITGNVEVQRSLSFLKEHLEYHLKEDSNGNLIQEEGNYIGEGVLGMTNIGKVFAAFSSDIASRSERAYLDSKSNIKEANTFGMENSIIGSLTNPLISFNNETEIDPIFNNRISLVKKEIDDGVFSINLKVNFNGKTELIPLKTQKNLLTSDIINQTSNLITVDKTEGSNLFIPIDNKLSFTKDKIKFLMNALNIDSAIQSLLLYPSGEQKIDITNFLSNLAFSIYLNTKDSDLDNSEILLRELGISKKTVKDVVERSLSKTTELEYDPYTILWRARKIIVNNSISKSNNENQNQLSIGGGSMIDNSATANNDNLPNVINKVKELGDEALMYTSNPIVNGKYTFFKTVFIGNFYDNRINRFVKNTDLNEYDLKRINVEKGFFGRYFNNPKEITLQLFVSERKLPRSYIFKSNTRDAIPFNTKGKLDEELLKGELIKTRRNSINDLQRGVLSGYIEVLEDKDYLTKQIRKIHPELKLYEIDNFIHQAIIEIEGIITGENINKLSLLNDFLKNNKRFLGVDVLNLLPQVIEGDYYNNKTGFISDQLIIDIDIWNNNMKRSENGIAVYSEEDRKITTSNFIDSLIRMNEKYVQDEIGYKEASVETTELFNERFNSKFKDANNLNRKEVAYTLNKAYQYNYLIFDDSANNLRIGRSYQFMSERELEVPYSDINILEHTLSNFSEALAKRSKRDGVQDSVGKRLMITKTNNHSAMKEDYFVATYQDLEEVVQTLGDAKLENIVIQDGADLGFPELFEIMKRSTGDDLSYNMGNQGSKDLHYEHDVKHGTAFMGKRALHNMFDSSFLSDGQYNILKYFRERTFLNNGKSKKVFVPLVQKEEIIEKGISSIKTNINHNIIIEKEFVTSQDIFEYLGDRTNPDVVSNFVDVLFLKQNFDIRNKFFGHIAIASTRKLGGKVLNENKNYLNPNGSVEMEVSNVGGDVLILQLQKEADKQHEVMNPTQLQQSSLAGVVSRKEGSQIYSALTSIFKSKKIFNNEDIFEAINSFLADPLSYLYTKEEIDNKNVIVSNILNLEKELSDNNIDAFDELLKLRDLTSKFIFRIIAVNNLQSKIINDSNSDAIKDAIKNKGNIDGVINNMYISMVHSKAKDSLTIKMNGSVNVATDVNKLVGVYDIQGKTYSKTDLQKVSDVDKIMHKNYAGELMLELKESNPNLSEEELIDIVKKELQDKKTVHSILEENFKNLKKEKLNNSNLIIADSKVEEITNSIEYFLKSNDIDIEDEFLIDIVKNLSDKEVGFVKVNDVYIVDADNYSDINLFLQLHKTDKVLVVGEVNNFKNDFDVVLTDNINIIKDNSSIFDITNSLDLQAHKLFQKLEDDKKILFDKDCKF